MLLFILLAIILILVIIIINFHNKFINIYVENRNLLSNLKLQREQTKYYQNLCSIYEYNEKVQQLTDKTVTNYKPNRNLKIILADYNKNTANISNRELYKMGIETIVVESGEDVLFLLENNYDCNLIITNNVFQNYLQGPDVLFKIKELDYGVPVSVLTIDKNREDYFLHELGFDGYMTKILTEKQIKKLIKKLYPKIRFKKQFKMV